MSSTFHIIFLLPLSTTNPVWMLNCPLDLYKIRSINFMSLKKTYDEFEEVLTQPPIKIFPVQNRFIRSDFFRNFCNDSVFPAFIV